jgi:hypothetical protein
MMMTYRPTTATTATVLLPARPTNVTTGGRKRKREPQTKPITTTTTTTPKKTVESKRQSLISRIWTVDSTAYDRYTVAARICDRTGADFDVRTARWILTSVFNRVLTLWPNRLAEPDDDGLLQSSYPAFRSPILPPSSVEPYQIFETVLRLSRSGFPTGILAIMILGSMINATPALKLSRWNVHRAVLGATVTAYKFDLDVAPSNAPMADRIGRYLPFAAGVRTFNDIELETAFIVRWNISYADNARADFFAGLAVQPLPSLPSLPS